MRSYPRISGTKPIELYKQNFDFRFGLVYIAILAVFKDEVKEKENTFCFILQDELK